MIQSSVVLAVVLLVLVLCVELSYFICFTYVGCTKKSAFLWIGKSSIHGEDSKKMGGYFTSFLSIFVAVSISIPGMSCRTVQKADQYDHLSSAQDPSIIPLYWLVYRDSPFLDYYHV